MNRIFSTHFFGRKRSSAKTHTEPTIRLVRYIPTLQGLRGIIVTFNYGNRCHTISTNPLNIFISTRLRTVPDGFQCGCWGITNRRRINVKNRNRRPAMGNSLNPTDNVLSICHKLFRHLDFKTEALTGRGLVHIHNLAAELFNKINLLAVSAINGKTCISGSTGVTEACILPSFSYHIYGWGFPRAFAKTTVHRLFIWGHKIAIQARALGTCGGNFHFGSQCHVVHCRSPFHQATWGASC